MAQLTFVDSPVLKNELLDELQVVPARLHLQVGHVLVLCEMQGHVGGVYLSSIQFLGLPRYDLLVTIILIAPFLTEFFLSGNTEIKHDRKIEGFPAEIFS